MRSKAFSKGFTIIAGVLAAVVILLSQSFYQQAQDNLKKVKTEQSADQNEVVISAPADAVPGAGAIQLEDNVPTLVKSTVSEDQEQTALPFATKILVSYYRILLKTLISPNAP
jgi:predicted PurR-regulated permease PerM